MGYTIKDIAKITEPGKLTVSGDSNFIVFESKTAAGSKAEATLDVTSLPTSAIVITDYTGAAHTFTPTADPERVTGYTFYADPDLANTAQNIRIALLADPWIAANFTVSVPVIWTGGNPSNGTAIRIVSKGTGTEYGINILFLGSRITAASSSGDSLKGDAGSASIDLDVYTDTGAPIGADDKGAYPGTYATTLQKTYAGAPVWFDLNALFAGIAEFPNPPAVPGWFDPETMRDYRFTARRTSHTSDTFYESGVLYALIGAEAPRDLAPYIFNGTEVRLLTNKPRTPYVTGGRAYLNFIRGAVSGTLRVAYYAYSNGEQLLGVDYAHECDAANLGNLNTCVLDLDSVIARYPKTGVIKVALSRGTQVVSDFLTFDILPECLHEVRYLSFINDLGGWEAVNLDASGKNDVKPSYSTYDRTITPQNSARERVYSVELSDTFTVESAPLPDCVATWLKELARSKNVVDGQGRNILITDFTLSIAPDTKNMQRATIKYRYADGRTLY